MVGSYKIKTGKIKVDSSDSKFVDPKGIGTGNVADYFPWFESSDNRDRVCLSLNCTDYPESSSDAVVITPYGGMASQGYVFHQDPKTWKTDFILNFEPFFKECLKDCEFVPPGNFKMTVDLSRETRIADEPACLPGECPSGILRRVVVLYKGSLFDDFTMSNFYRFSGTGT